MMSEKSKVTALQKTATAYKKKWEACLAQDVQENIQYQTKIEARDLLIEENNRLCSAAKSEVKIVLKHHRTNKKCISVGVGESLIDEAEEYEKAAAVIMQEYHKLMKKIEEEAASATEKKNYPFKVDRWDSNQKVNDGSKTEDDHDSWHKQNQGTARQKGAHQDMHKKQAANAKALSDEACNNKASAEAERKALVVQKKAAIH